MGFTWQDALALAAEVTRAIVGACIAGRGREAAVRDARAVLDRRAQIDADVDDAAGAALDAALDASMDAAEPSRR